MLGQLSAFINSFRVAWATRTRRDPTWHFYGKPIIKVCPGGKLHIGSDVTALSEARYNEIGLLQPVVITVLEREASISIGDKVGISGCTLSARSSIVVGSGTQIGSGALIMDHDAHVLPLGTDGEVKTKPVMIGENVFIGARAIILKGVSVGDYAVIGAGAVVTRDVPSRAIVAGNPAQVIRQC